MKLSSGLYTQACKYVHIELYIVIVPNMFAHILNMSIKTDKMGGNELILITILFIVYNVVPQTRGC